MLFGAPGAAGRDLFALNIQRGRDHGLPDYNTARIACGLAPVEDFAGISSDPQVQEALEEAYGEVRSVDLLAGGLAEDHLPGAMLGETFHAILVDQFQRLRHGDRFWFENDAYFLDNPALLAEVRATTLADIIRRNTDIGDELPDRVFGGPPPPATITIEFGPVWSSFEWQGEDGIAVRDALREGGIFENVVAIYSYDQATRTWLAFLPAFADAPVLDLLTTLEQGRTYWIVGAEPATWSVTEVVSPRTVSAAGPTNP